MIKLCYKKYNWKISNGACRSFTEKTGKDLNGIFADYIVASINLNDGVSIFERTEIFRRLHSKEDACKALFAIISAADDSIDIEEIEDAAYRVSWTSSDRPDDLSEPWPLVMLDAAFQINNYMCDNLPSKKKVATSEE